MKKDERKTLCKIVAAIGIGIILWVYLYTLPVSAKKAVFTDDQREDEYFITEEAESPENVLFDANSAMPCVDSESFKKWMETYEQETSEEVTSGRTESTERIDAECVPVQKTEEVQMETATKTYAVGESILNPDIQAYLYQRLADHHIEWFMPYAIMMAYQESHFDQYAVNPHNGIDCGLFQFRAPYYEGQDIFNPYEQIDIFTQQMANRANAGRTVSEMISAHNVSDYGGYNQSYVDQVLAHANNLREVK